MPTFEGETIRLLSHGGKSLVGIEPIASDREAAPLTARPSLLSPKARAKLRLLFFSSIADQSEHSSISRDGSHWIIRKRKQTARNEVKPLKLKCRSLSFHKCLACNLSDLPSFHAICIRKQLNFAFACILLDQEVATKFNFDQ